MLVVCLGMEREALEVDDDCMRNDITTIDDRLELIIISPLEIDVIDAILIIPRKKPRYELRVVSHV